jgi:hypothetical protein
MAAMFVSGKGEGVLLPASAAAAQLPKHTLTAAANQGFTSRVFMGPDFQW